MGSRTRRDFLKLCATSTPALILASQNSVHASANNLSRTPALIDRFIDPLPFPKRLRPHSTHGGKAEYRVQMLESSKRFHSQLPPTRFWGFEGQYPGPTFDVVAGQPITVKWENRLPRRHLFAVDPHIHGAMPPIPTVRTVPHLHGSRTPSESDGLPEKWFAPGESARYFYPNEQQAATLWYHDHAVGITRLNVYAGLSGFFLLRDDRETRLNLPAGEYEIPLLLQDRTLDDRGQLVYCPAFEDGTIAPPGVWAPEFFGDLPIVNGAIYPFLAVEPRPYRLRVLNGSNSRFFNLYLNLAKSPTDIPALVSFHQIGTDGGFLPSPVSLTTLLLGPAERADLVVDFSAFNGKTLTLSNNAAAPYPGWNLMHHHAPLPELMQFRVTRPLSITGRAHSIPQSIALPGLDPGTAVTIRDFVLTEQMDAQGRSRGVRINAKGYDDPVTEQVTLGSSEKWRFINMTDDAHPMHLHLVQFRIVERQGFDATSRAGAVRLTGNPRPPQPNEAGWKDTAVVYPGEVLTILVKFEGYAGRYVFHCHMLEHEDNDMMRPYEIIA
ncbi:MAG TPA: multicopper oxidase domain-containing protein [Acidobacteriaceae bacterium]|jgi:spore coat protein A